MAFDESNGGGIPATMLVGPTGYGGNYGGGFGGFGGDWGWIVLLLLLAGNGGWGFGGMGGGMWPMMMGMDGGFGLYPWMSTNNNVSDGFRSAQLSDSVTSVRDGISALSTQLCGCCGDLSTQLCNGFNGTVNAVNGAQNAIAQQLYTNQIADMERSFAAQTASTAGLTNISAQLANCCCENRAATQDVKYTIATEACATRAANTANTQAILDKLCALELDGYKRENDQLRTQLNMANLAASQTAQTAELRQSGATQLNQLVSELRSCPIPAQPVYGNQPIFTCSGNSCGCGCGSGFAN